MHKAAIIVTSFKSVAACATRHDYARYAFVAR